MSGGIDRRLATLESQTAAAHKPPIIHWRSFRNVGNGAEYTGRSTVWVPCDGYSDADIDELFRLPDGSIDTEQRAAADIVRMG